MFTKTYTFRAFSEAKLDDVVKNLPVPENTRPEDKETAQAKVFAQFFDKLDKKNAKNEDMYQRKTVTVELPEPEFFGAIEDKTALEVLRGVIADYAMATYIDGYEDVGEFSWDDIVKSYEEAAASGSSAVINISESQLAALAEAFAAFTMQTYGSEPIAKCFGDVVSKKATQRAFTTVFGSCTEKLVTKFESTLKTYHENAAAEDALTDDIDLAFQFVMGKIKTVKKSFNSDLQSAMAQVFGDLS